MIELFGSKPKLPRTLSWVANQTEVSEWFPQDATEQPLQLNYRQFVGDGRTIDAPRANKPHLLISVENRPPFVSQGHEHPGRLLVCLFPVRSTARARARELLIPRVSEAREWLASSRSETWYLSIHSLEFVFVPESSELFVRETQASLAVGIRVLPAQQIASADRSSIRRNRFW